MWGLIISDLECGRYKDVPSVEANQRLQELATARNKQGIAKYGVSLPVDSGRNSRLDELQEALDGMAYSRQTWEQERRYFGEAMTGPSVVVYQRHWERGQRAWARHLRCLQTVLELLEELEP